MKFLCRHERVLLVPCGHFQLVRPCVPFLGDPKQFLADRRRFGKSDLPELRNVNPQKAYLVKAIFTLDHVLALCREGGRRGATRRKARSPDYIKNPSNARSRTLAREPGEGFLFCPEASHILRRG